MHGPLYIKCKLFLVLWQVFDIAVGKLHFSNNVLDFVVGC